MSEIDIQIVETVLMVVITVVVPVMARLAAWVRRQM